MLGGMGFKEVASLPTKYREEFPVCRELIYLNHAAVSPLCRRAAEAIKAMTEDACLFGSLNYERWMDAYRGLRMAAARLINASPEEIAIVKNTSEGISIVALGLQWKSGDRIVAFREEFPANYYPWARLERLGVRIEWLSIYDPIEQITPAILGARLLAISFVNYLSGFRADLKALGEICRQCGCFFFVDAIQGTGAIPLDVEACHIDGLAADGHKWMLGPEGNGMLYIRRSRMDEIEPAEFGWTNAKNYVDYANRDMTLRPDAGRYECGTLNTVGCYGHRAALEFLLEVGIENVASAVDARAQQIEDGVRERGYELMIKRTPETGSGIVTFRHPTIQSSVLVSQLKRARILATSRQGWIRMSPHFYLSPDDIEQVLEHLPPV